MKFRITSTSSFGLLLASSLSTLLSGCGAGGDAAPSTFGSAAAPTQLAASISSAALTDIYVNPNGLDTNAGTAAAPVKTIARAAQLAGPGSTVHVAPGTYAGGFQTTVSGSATARVRFLSDKKWGARIVPPATSSSAAAWDNRGSYVDIDGFEIDGSNLDSGTPWSTGIYAGGANTNIRNNHVHHIGASGSCLNGGAIGADSYYKGTNNDVFANQIHHIGVSGCASMFGVYVNTPDSDVSNNLVYAVSGAGVRMWHDAMRVKVVNNTITQSGTGVAVGGGNNYFTSGPNDYTKVSNNVIAHNRYGVVESGATGRNNVYRNNLMYQNAMLDFQLANGLVASATVSAAPGFVDMANADFHLAAGSAAIGRAYGADAPGTDLDGAARPSGSSYDIGAYQYIARAEVPEPAFSVVTSNHLYVATTGSDSNPGSATAPLKTLARAAALVKPDTTVHVAPGTYYGGIKTTISGTATARIYYVSTVKWGARIVPPLNSVSDTAWDNRANYVEINGFDIDGSAIQSGTPWTHGIYTGGSYGMIKHNRIRNVATKVACTSAGGSAIGIDSYYRGIKTDVINNTVYDIGAPGCAYIQGIYMSTSGSIQSNLVYRVGQAAIHLWHDASDVLIANNTVTSSGFGIIVGGGDFYYDSTGADNVRVMNNIVYDNKYGISEQGKTGTTNVYTNNLVFQNPGYNLSLKNGLIARSTTTADPQFRSYVRSGSSDFQLKSSSPAIGIGATSLAPRVDIEGYLRSPVGLGAYQFR